MNVKSDSAISNCIRSCIRCGACCKKGGPCFHLEDKKLIEKGIILTKYLFTIRAGEPAYDNVKEKILPAVTDIIKIKGKKGSWACVFYNEKEKRCMIYDNRPVECKALKCWDTQEIRRIYSKNRLIRKDLIFKVKGLWDLVKDHQSRCSYEKIKRFAETINYGVKNCEKKEATQSILDMIKYDHHIRLVVVEKIRLDSDILDFLFGRPLTMTIKMFGLKVMQKNNDFSLSLLRVT